MPLNEQPEQPLMGKSAFETLSLGVIARRALQDGYQALAAGEIAPAPPI
jgi:hypothetical protein